MALFRATSYLIIITSGSVQAAHLDMSGKTNIFEAVQNRHKEGHTCNQQESVYACEYEKLIPKRLTMLTRTFIFPSECLALSPTALARFLTNISSLSAYYDVSQIKPILELKTNCSLVQSERQISEQACQNV
ncbi:hypothetical protein ACTXT7_016635 [Hymenolepis weldensis]